MGWQTSKASNQQLTNQPTDQPTNQATNQLTNQPTNRGADLPNYSQNKRLRPPVPRILHRDEEEDPKSCFKIAQIRICIS